MSLRVIGGSLKRKKLHTVRGKHVRPTADHLRESIFNILSSRVSNAVVLDLFAGTGAFGIEAVSRGAKHAVLIDNSRDALAVMAKNIKACAFGDQMRIINWDIKKNLNCIHAFHPTFNLVFLDPPYNQNLVQPALFNLSQSNALEKAACITVEHAVTEPLQGNFQAFALDDQRRYGKTLVSFLTYVV